MATVGIERVLDVHHWNETLFSFKTTRDQGLRFENGHFVMIGLEVEGKPLMRAYSIASPNYDEHLEFLITLSRYASIAIENAGVVYNLKKKR